MSSRRLASFVAALLLLGPGADAEEGAKRVTPEGTFPQAVSPSGESDAGPVMVREVERTEAASFHVVRLAGAEKPHVHGRHDLVAYLISGDAELHLDRRSERVKTGDVVRVPRGTVHWAENRGAEPARVYAVFSPPYDGRDYLAVTEGGDSVEKVVKTDAEWRSLLSPEEFKILRRKGTEQPFTGTYHASKDNGVYRCAACGLDLFGSEAKFDSGTGWPSFWKPLDERHVASQDDRSLFMHRTEVVCARCNGHLGHVFNDGPKPTGLRYCINSVSLKFEKGS